MIITKPGFFLIFMIILASCTSRPESTAATIKVVQDTSLAGQTMPLIYNWRLGEKTIVDLNGVSFIILGIQLNGSETNLFFALIGNEIDSFFKDYTIEMMDDLDLMGYPISVIPLGWIEEFDFGILKFSPRYSGTTKLFLNIADKSKSTDEQRLLFAIFNGPPSEDRLFSTYFAGEQYGIEINGNRLQMFFTLPISEKDALDQLPVLGTAAANSITDVPVRRPSWVKVSKGIDVYSEYAITVEKTEKPPVQYLAFQLMSDGSAIVALDHSVFIPTPILLATPAPEPYPGIEVFSPYEFTPYPEMVQPLQATLSPYP
jgi:hypothetical protein